MGNIALGLNNTDTVNAIQAANKSLNNALFTGSKILITDANKKIVESTNLATDLEYIKNATGNFQTQINGKANSDSPTFTGIVSGITSEMVGLGNVTNESKATMFTDPTFTGTVSVPTTPVNDTDATSKSYVDSYHANYFSQVTDVVVSNTTIETTLFDGTGTIPANSLRQGDIILIDAYGKMSTYTTNQQAQVRLMFDGTDLLGSSSLIVSTGALTDELFVNRFLIKVKGIGSTGTMQCVGYTFIHQGSGIVSPVMREIYGSDKTIDTTQDITIDETYQWAVADTDNTITMSTVIIRRMN